MSGQVHTIKYVSMRTGLSQHTIRAWERRYAALTPDRTATNRRLYSAEDVEKLLLLGKAISGGHSIGSIASLSTSELKSMCNSDETFPVYSAPDPPEVFAEVSVEAILAECKAAIDSLDAASLSATVSSATARLGSTAVIDRVVVPLLRQIGDEWRNGELRPAHEHLATATLRSHLGRMLGGMQAPAGAPRVVVTTPASQVHELGALIAAVTAASVGWAPLYLGPSLPADEIAGAVLKSHARAVALSIMYPVDESRMADEISLIRHYIGPHVRLLAGGTASSALLEALKAVDGIYLKDMNALRNELQTIRSTDRA